MTDNAPNPFAFTLGDRLRRSLKVSGLTVQGMADYLGVSRTTVSTWLNDRHRPSQQSLMLWAMKTGAAVEWLRGDDGFIASTARMLSDIFQAGGG